MKKGGVGRESNVVKLGGSTEKADLYLDHLVAKVNKGKGVSFLEVNERGEIILHQQGTAN